MSKYSLDRICVAGAGAIGGTLAARLGAAGRQVNVLARGATLDALRQSGIKLNDRSGGIRVNVNASDLPDFGVQDIIFLCVKSYALPAIASQIAPLIGKHTIVVPTGNGVPWWYFQGEPGPFEGEPVKAVDPNNKISTLIPSSQILGCVNRIMADALAPGVIVAEGRHSMTLGEINHRMTDRLAGVCAILTDAGIETRPCDRIRDDLWMKLIANLTSNPLSVVCGATLRDIYGRKELRELVINIIHEVTLVAASYGTRISINPHAFLALGESMGPFRTSMLQDYEKGRPLELAAIGDAVIELAERFDIPMPATRAVLALARFFMAQGMRQQHDAPAEANGNRLPSNSVALS